MGSSRVLWSRTTTITAGACIGRTSSLSPSKPSLLHHRHLHSLTPDLPLPSPVSTTTIDQHAPPSQPQWRISTPSSEYHPRIRGLPRHILLLRHGQSLGNVDETLFTSTPDWKIPLSDHGKAQARDAGLRIQRMIPRTSPLVAYVSPYTRTKETYQQVQTVLRRTHTPVLFTREEPRLREQDFGNFQDYKLIQKAKRERPRFGRFFYRFPNGESGADVFDRVSAFTGTFRQDMEQIINNRLGMIQAGAPKEQYNALDMEHGTALLVTHGITARLFLMRWLHWSVDEFEMLHNPPNCGLLHLQRTPDGSSYRLTQESQDLIQAPNEAGGALQLGKLLEQRRQNETLHTTMKDREAFEHLADAAWGT